MQINGRIGLYTNENLLKELDGGFRRRRNMATSKRLFIGLELTQMHKQNLSEMDKRIKMFLKEGTIVSKDHFHLTLKFLGETKIDRIPVIEETMKVSEKVELFLTEISGLGEFDKEDKKMVWVGIRNSKQLAKLYELLEAELEALFFDKSEFPFVPHITLAKEATYLDGIKSVEELKDKITFGKLPLLITKIVLFENVREDEYEKYQIIYEAPLAFNKGNLMNEETIEKQKA